MQPLSEEDLHLTGLRSPEPCLMPRIQSALPYVALEMLVTLG